MDETVGQDDWWQSLYDETLAELFLVRKDPAEVQATVAFLTDQLAVAPGRTVFDQCCGIGSLSIPLARTGARVIGVDQSEPYIRRAREEARAGAADCEFYRADAFTFVPGRPCDGAFNWWTSFGYAADDRRNGLMLRRAFEALRPGGRFALDYPNMARILRDFQACMVRRQATGSGDIVLLRESTVDLARGSLDQRWTYMMPDGRRVVRRSALRLYLPHVLAELVEQCGFVEIAFWGGVRGETLELDSPRCICTARRPGP